jgi:hypothetical protein
VLTAKQYTETARGLGNMQFRILLQLESECFVINVVRLVAITLVTFKITVSWGVMFDILIDRFKCFGRMYNYLGKWLYPKRWYMSIKLHGITL